MRGINALVACVAVGVLGVGAFGQAMTPVAVDTSPRLDRTPVWKAVLKIQKEQAWDVDLQVRGFVIPTCGVEEGNPSEGTFCVPLVMSSATQTADEGRLSVKLNGVAVGGTEIWADSPAGMEHLRAVEVTAPPGNSFDFMTGLPLRPDMKALTVDLELTFSATARSVVLDEEVAGRAGWPSAWPPEAQGALDAQAYRDTGVDAKSGLVRDLDTQALDAIAQEVARSRGIKDPRAVPPLRLAEEIAAAVLQRVPLSGDGLARLGAPQQKRPPVPGASVRVMPPSAPVMRGGFMGFEVRDALTVLRSGGTANQFERAVALAAVYRRLGLPCRVMTGFEARGGANVPAARAWVEFAVYDASEGIAWVPVDTGRGGRVEVGTLRDGEQVVVLASNLWPPSVREVGAELCNGCARDFLTLDAGLWGFWTGPVGSHAALQELAVSAVKQAVTSGDRGLKAVPRKRN